MTEFLKLIWDRWGFQPPVDRTLVTLQWLRFLAAGVVLLSHVGDRLLGFGERYGSPVHFVAFSGSFGVSVFFAISGFIMVYVAGDKFGSAKNAAHFIRNRALRVIPLYWVTTLIQAALILASGSLATEQGRLTWGAMAKSLTFVPYLNWLGRHRPVLEVGWTLNYEMVFYGLFALALLAPRRFGLPAICVALLFMGVGPFGEWPAPFGLWANSIVLYFLLGLAFGLLRQALARREMLRSPVSPAVVALALVAGFTALDNIVASVIWEPIFVSAAIGSAVFLKERDGSRLAARIMTALGDLSYSLYLTHGFALLFVGIVWRKIFGGDHLAGYYILAVGCSLLAGAVCHLLLERPLTVFASRTIRRRRDNVPSTHGEEPATS